jgi:hypothetical protein
MKTIFNYRSNRINRLPFLVTLVVILGIFILLSMYMRKIITKKMGTQTEDVTGDR